MKLIGIYPGNFQPPTRSHLQVYKKLRQIVGPDTFVVTTDRIPTPDAPLNIGDKEQIWVRHGVPASSIQKIQDWKQPDEIFHKFSSNHTGVVFALNQIETNKISKRKARSSQVKDKLGQEMDKQSPGLNELAISPTSEQDKEVWIETDGKLNYFQPYKGNENFMKSFDHHAYVIVVDDDKIDEKPISTANIRQVFGSPLYTEDGKKKFFRFIFGWFDVGLYTLMINKFRSAYQVSSNDEQPSEKMPSTTSVPSVVKTNHPIKSSSSAFRENITKMVHEILREIMDEDYSSSSSTMSSTTDDSGDTGMASSLDKQKSPAEQKSDAQKKKVGLVQKKKEAEAEAKKNKQQRDQYSTVVKSYDTFQKKNDREALNTINRELSNPIEPMAPIA